MAKITQDIGNQERLVQDVTATQQNVFKQTSKELEGAKDFNRLLDLFPSIAGVVNTTIQLETQKKQIEQQKEEEKTRQANLAINSGVKVEQIADPEAREMVDIGYQIESAGKNFLDETSNGVYDELTDEEYRSVWMKNVGNSFINEKNISNKNQLAFIQLKMADFFKNNSEVHSTRRSLYEEEKTKTSAKGEVLSQFQSLQERLKNEKLKKGENFTEEDYNKYLDEAGKLIIDMPKIVSNALSTFDKKVNFKNADVNPLMLITMQTMVEQGMPVDLFIEASKTPYSTKTYKDKDNNDIKDKASFYAANSVQIESLRIKEKKQEAIKTMQQTIDYARDSKMLDEKIKNKKITYADIFSHNEKWKDLGYSETKFTNDMERVAGVEAFNAKVSVAVEGVANAYDFAVKNNNPEVFSDALLGLSWIQQEDPEVTERVSEELAIGILGSDWQNKISEMSLTPLEFQYMAEIKSQTGYVIPEWKAIMDIKDINHPNYPKKIQLNELAKNSGVESFVTISAKESLGLTLDKRAIESGKTPEERKIIQENISNPNSILQVDSGTIREIGSIVIDKNKEYRNPSFDLIDTVTPNDNIHYSGEYNRIVTELAAMTYAAGNINIDESVDETLKTLYPRTFIEDTDENRGAFNFIDKNVLNLIPEKYTPTHIVTKGEIPVNVKNFIEGKKYFIKEFEKRNKEMLDKMNVDSVHLRMGEQFDKNGIYELWTNTGEKLSNLTDADGNKIDDNTRFGVALIMQSYSDKKDLERKNELEFIGSGEQRYGMERRLSARNSEKLKEQRIKYNSINSEIGETTGIIDLIKEDTKNELLDLIKSETVKNPQPVDAIDINNLDNFNK